MTTRDYQSRSSTKQKFVRCQLITVQQNPCYEATPSATISWPHKRGGHITGLKYNEKYHFNSAKQSVQVVFIEGDHITGVLLYSQTEMVLAHQPSIITMTDEWQTTWQKQMAHKE